VAAAGGLDADRLYAWCQVIAPMVAIGELTGKSAEPVLAELFSLMR
jgi:hypothetical protein